jgi:hypothetical protein
MPSKVVMKSRQSLPLAPWSPSWEPLSHQCGTNLPKESWLNANGEYDTRSGPEAQTNAAWPDAGRDFTQQHSFSFDSRLLYLGILSISMATINLLYHNRTI